MGFGMFWSLQSGEVFWASTNACPQVEGDAGPIRGRMKALEKSRYQSHQSLILWADLKHIIYLYNI